MSNKPITEGGLKSAQRHPIKWRQQEYYDEQALIKEIRRVFEICHGCRRCFNLCNAFPRLFDAIDNSESMTLDGVDDATLWKIVDDCFLCDRCFEVKCPYVPPHPFNVDFPHVMLRAKAIKHKQGHTKLRDKLLTSTESIGKLASIPIVVNGVNQVNKNKITRKIMHHSMGIHKNARLPKYVSKNKFKKIRQSPQPNIQATTTKRTTGRVVLFYSCYGKYNDNKILEDLIYVFEHNNIQLLIPDHFVCCGMPKLEIGDFSSVEKYLNSNAPTLANYVSQGWDIVSPIPSCVLMFRNELPLLFEDNQALHTIKKRFFEPFEYLNLRHLDKLLQTDFKQSLGTVSYHAPCHLSALGLGIKTKKILSLVPDTQVILTDRCSGHDGTYGIRKETHETSLKIGKPVFKHMQNPNTNHTASNCPIAALQIDEGTHSATHCLHPLSLLRKAYEA